MVKSKAGKSSKADAEEDESQMSEEKSKQEEDFGRLLVQAFTKPEVVGAFTTVLLPKMMENVKEEVENQVKVLVNPVKEKVNDIETALVVCRDG